MTASWRGLAILTALAVALAIAVVLDAPPRGAVADRRLAPMMTVERVQAIALAGGEPITLSRAPDGSWQVTAPAPGPADGDIVGDLLAAVVAARVEREVPEAPASVTGLDHPAHTAVLTLGETTVRIAIGRPVTGADQVWARRDDGPPVLVPAWLASAVGRGVDDLRQRALVRVRDSDITGLELHGGGIDLVASGAPMIGRYAEGGGRLRPAQVAVLARALAGLRAASFPRTAVTGSDGLAIRVLGGPAVDELAIAGPCPDHVDQIAVTGTAGAVCVDTAAIARVTAAAAALADPLQAIDPSPIALGWQSLAWPATSTIVTVTGGGFTVTAAAAAVPVEDDALRPIAEALAAPGQVVPRPAGSPAAPAVIARYADGHVDQLFALGGDLVARNDERVAIRIGPAAQAALRVTALALRDRGLVLEDASGLTALVVTARGQRRSAARGAVIGEWTGDLDPARVTSAAAVIADLRAAAFVELAPSFAARARIEAEFAAPPVAGAPPAHHVIELGDHCLARVDGIGVTLDAARCAALAALAP
ncbi:MAG: DUF4340 domain-containing protein [Deltaproteobacteria bacterium]|nr:DUF4340 domain-containing protein [Deltaproteobacteria bacterium]